MTYCTIPSRLEVYFARRSHPDVEVFYLPIRVEWTRDEPSVFSTT